MIVNIIFMIIISPLAKTRFFRIKEDHYLSFL